MKSFKNTKLFVALLAAFASFLLLNPEISHVTEARIIRGLLNLIFAVFFTWSIVEIVRGKR